MVLNLTSSILALMLPTVITAAALVLSFHTYLDREKSSPFECGFDPKSSARLPFSLRFFLLAVLFLVFDIEIVLLLPSPLILPSSASVLFTFPFFGFLIILIFGLLHEWNEGSLDWRK